MTMGTCNSVVAQKSETTMRLPKIVLAIAAAFAHCGSFFCVDASFATVQRKNEVGAAAAAARTKQFLPSHRLVRPQKLSEATALLHAQKKPVIDPKSAKGDNASDSKVNYVRIFSPLNPYMWFVYMFLFIYGADAVNNL